MNKWLVIFFFFSLFGTSQEDSISFSDYEEQEVYVEPQILPKNFEPKFKEKYYSSEFIYEELKNTDLSEWDKFWQKVRDFFGNLFNFSPAKGTFTALEWFFKILAFLLIAFVVYMIIRVIIKKESNWIFSSPKKKILVSELVEENIHTTDFKSLIAKAKQNKEYRISIRYYYLWLLKSFSDKNIIEWDIEKTNSDYLYEIENHNTKKDFQFLSYIYDYCWYGEFNITESDFDKAEKSFLKAIEPK